MAWTAPRTWVAGETVTAALMNTHVRDNLKAIGDPWTAYTPTIVNVTTSSIFANFLAAGKWIEVRFKIVISAAPTGVVTLSVPVTASTSAGTTSAIGNVLGLRGTFQHAAVNQITSTTVNFMSHGGATAWAAGVPVAWANTDVWSGHFGYEAA